MIPTTPARRPRLADVATAVLPPTVSRGRRVGRGLRRLLALSALAAFASGCGGGGSDGVLRVSVAAHGRVAAGGIGGSTLEVYRLGEYGAPVATTTTSTGATLAEIGRFSFDLADVSPDALFLLVATGGTAHDEDEDGVMDGPTASAGRIHAIASAAQLSAGEVLLSTVTDVVYFRARYYLQARYDAAYVARACDAWASFVLRASIAGGPAIDQEDALAYDPRVHAGATFRPAQDFRDYVHYVLLGATSVPDAFHLSEPEMNFQVLPDQTFGIDLAGNLAYVCRGTAGLAVWDVSNPTHFQSVGAYDTPGQAGRVQVVGSLAYVADGTGGLRILDVSDPATPTPVGSLTVPGSVVDLHVVGNLAFLVNGDPATPMLQVVDVSTPSAPEILSNYLPDAAPTGVRAEGDYAYLMEDTQIEVVDVSAPALPVGKGVTYTDGYGRLDLGPDHLFVAADERLEVFSLAGTQSLPQSVATVSLPGFGSSGLRVRGTQAVVARGFGLALVDVSDPASPSLDGLIPTTGGVLDVDREGNLLMVTEVNGGLAAVGGGTPAPSGAVATVPLAALGDSVEAVGNRVYVTTSAPDELVVFDASNPLAPARRGDVPLGSHGGEDVAIDGSVAYVAEYGAFHAYGVANASAPTSLSADDTRGGLRGLAVGSNVVYATSGSHLDVYDVSSPSSVSHVASLPVAGNAAGVARSGNALVVAAGPQGIFTYDATTPTAPTQAGHLDLFETLDVDLQPPFACVTRMPGWWNRGQLVLVDCTDLSAPALGEYASLPGAADQLARSGSFVYVSSWATGVHVVDVSKPAGPHCTATIPVPGNVADLDAEGGYVYAVTTWPQGALHVLRAAQVAVP